MRLWATRGDWEARRPVLTEGIRSLRPDLLALQETVVREGYDQVVELLEPGYHVVHQERREPNGQGISMASRWPIEDVEELEQHVTPRTAGFGCTTLLGRVRAPDPIGSVLFVNHYPSWRLDLELERELQAVRAADTSRSD